MARDLLADLKVDSNESVATNSSSATEEPKKAKAANKFTWASKGKVTPAAMEDPAKLHSSPEMHKFFETVAEVRSEMTTCSGLIEEVKLVHSRTLDAITEQQHNGASKELEELMDKITTRTRTLQETLKKMDLETKAMKAKNAKNQDVPIREAQFAVSLQAFGKIIQDYKYVQEDHQLRLKERLTKHVMVVNPKATKADVDKVMLGEKIFAPQNTQQRAEARAALEEINKKHRDVTKLTESILELQQLFLDVSVLIQAQGNMLDHAVVNVESAVKDTEEGTEHLDQAIKKQKKTRKMMCIIMCLVIGIIAVAIGVPALLGKL